MRGDGIINVIKCRYRHRLFTSRKAAPFSSVIYNSEVRIYSEGELLFIEIQGRKASRKLLLLESEIESLLFFLPRIFSSDGVNSSQWSRARFN